MQAQEGLCPRCNERGVVGHACPGSHCVDHGVCFVPERFLPRGGLRDKRLGQLVGPWLIVERKKHYDAPVVYRVLHQPAMLEGELVLVDRERAREARDNLLRQAMAMARTWHPNVQRLIDFGEDEHGTWLVSDVHGAPHTLADLMATDAEGIQARQWPGPQGLNRVPASAALALVDPLAAALEALADVKLVHGLIRPEHVLVYDVAGARGHVVLSGFVRVPTHDATTPPPTPRERVYQPPELLGTHTIGPTTDAYSVAAITFELLAGRPAFEPAALKDERGPDLGDLHAWPDAALTFFRRALAWAPSHRYGDAPSFHEALVAALAACEASWAPPRADDEGEPVVDDEAPVRTLKPTVLPPVIDVAGARADEDALDPWHWTEKNRLVGRAAPPPPTDEDEDAGAHRGTGTQIMSTDELDAAEQRARAVPRMHQRPAPQGH